MSLFQHRYVKYRPEICDDQKNSRGTKKKTKKIPRFITPFLMGIDRLQKVMSVM